MIRTEKLIKSYGKGELEVNVLKNLSLEIGKGEFVAIIGPSGAGKSTLLYQLSLLDLPTSGSVSINGKNMSAIPEKEKTLFRLRELGYVFQDYALLPELTAIENVALPILMQGISKGAALAQAEDALARLSLTDKKNSLPSQLSGGQQQRVSIARAIAHKPHILFADEPTANLDSVSAEPVMEAFAELHKQGQTIIMVTHETEYASKAGRVISLKDGVIVGDTRNS